MRKNNRKEKKKESRFLINSIPYITISSKLSLFLCVGVDPAG